MARLIVQLADEEKAKRLSEFIAELSYVDSVELSHNETNTANDEDFFSFSGLWKDRDINIETIRQQAWPEQDP